MSKLELFAMAFNTSAEFAYLNEWNIFSDSSIVLKAHFSSLSIFAVDLKRTKKT